MSQPMKIGWLFPANLYLDNKMNALNNVVSAAAEDASIMSVDAVDAGAISIEEIAMREEKSTFTICSYEVTSPM